MEENNSNCINTFHHLQMPPPLYGGETSTTTVDEAYINGVYAGLRFHSLFLTSGPETPNNLLKKPKTEPAQLSINDAVPPPPYDFFSETAAPSSSRQKLPNLLSLELPPPPPLKRRRGLSEKTSRLQKVLPWENRKMDMATVLGETYKYIKFLEAQVSVLRSMPAYLGLGDQYYGGGGVDHVLWRLSREELLGVVVNSPVAQRQLYSKGSCVCSLEQLQALMVRENATCESVALFHHHLLSASYF